MSYDLAEMHRMLMNMIRIGSIKAVDVGNRRVKVTTAGLTTDWIPWGTARAGKTRNWSAPNIGEQVVLFSPFGDMTQAVAGPSIYQDDFDAPADSADRDTILFPDGSTIDYNSETNTYSVNIVGSGLVAINCVNATITAVEKVTLDTPDTMVTGNLTVAKSFQMGSEGGTATMKGNVAITGGSLTHNGKNIGSTHQHSGVQTGGGNTQAPV